jgi:6-phosphogluconolactonase
MPEPEIVFCETPEDVADAAAALIFDDQTEAIGARGVYRIALSGGRTPELLFDQFASEEWRDMMAWENWEVFWADERAVPPDHPDSNFHLAQSTFLTEVPVGEIWRMHAEVADLHAAAEDYARTLRSRFSLGMPAFDTILLGMGADGHTASLFPAHPALDSTALVEAVEASVTPPRRLTLTLPVLNRALHVIFLVTGEEKSERVRDILMDDKFSFPAGRVKPDEGLVTWILDARAACLIR